MKIFTDQENKIKCGKCSTEFDLNKNKTGCPLCGFGISVLSASTENKESVLIPVDNVDFLKIPPSLDLKPGTVVVYDEEKTWGAWLMFNDFFAPKFLSRVLAWKLYKEEKDKIMLSDLMKESIGLIKKYNLSHLKGFPNLEKDREGTRLVYHFLRTFANMGLMDVNSINKDIKDVWKEKWDEIEVSLTKNGLEFARLKNQVFDEGKNEQILTIDEKRWLIDYLKQIDDQDYKEYSVLKDVYFFLGDGNNGNKDLWNWFENNQKFRDHILRRSERARNDDNIFQKQLHNYARSFASAKISLLRELGVVKNKRNNYTLIGDLNE